MRERGCKSRLLTHLRVEGRLSHGLQVANREREGEEREGEGEWSPHSGGQHSATRRSSVGTQHIYTQIHVLMRDEKEGRKKQAWSNKQQGKATQHTQGSPLPKTNELPQVGLEPTTLYTLDRALYSAGWAQTSHLIVHLMNRRTINSV